MNLDLARLALRRHFTPGLGICALALALLAATAHWGPPAGAVRELLDQVDPDGVERALARQGVWAVLSVFLAPFLVLRSAGAISTWRRGEVDWISSSPASPARVLLSTWIGACLAAGLAVLLSAVAAELAAGSGPAGMALVDRSEAPRAVLSVPGARSWTLESHALNRPGATVRVHVLLVAGGPAADVRLLVTRGGGVGEQSRRMSGRTELRVVAPAGEGPVEVRLELLEPDAIVALDASAVDVLAPVASERTASGRLGLHTWLALCAWLALALGLGAWVSTPTAALAVLALATASWSGLTGLPFPGHDLPAAYALVGERLAPPGPSAADVAGLALVAAAGLGLALAGFRGRRSA